MRTSELAIHLRAVYEKHGELTPRAVLDTGRDPEHPLHGEFTWDGEKAAEKQRLSEAAALIRRVKITVVSSSNPDVEVRIRQYVAPRDPRRPGVYVDAADANMITQQHLMGLMRNEWSALRRRWQNYGEFWAMIDQERDKDTGS